MHTIIKAERVVRTALGLLLREQTLPQLVWRDAAGDFAGAKNDTISLYLPAYAPARTRQLRSGTARTKDEIHERKVDVTLTTDVYKDVPISDEQLSLDISDFGAQVLNPVLIGVAERNEQELATTINGADYYRVITHDLSTDDAYNTVVAARIALNDAHVPLQGRRLLVGSAFEAALLTNEKFVHADKSGTTETLREAHLGRIAGFDVYSSPMVDGDAAIAFHQTAFAFANRAPIVPSGAPWGASQSFQGYAIRTVRVFDPNEVEDRFIADSWVGSNVVRDDGMFLGGKFVPTTEPGATLGAPVAVAGEADDDTFTAAGHGLQVGDTVKFPELTGGTGLVTDTAYHVIAAGLTTSTFRVSTTKGGSAVNFSTDVTAGAVAQLASPKLVRAVKISVVD